MSFWRIVYCKAKEINWKGKREDFWYYYTPFIQPKAEGCLGWLWWCPSLRDCTEFWRSNCCIFGCYGAIHWICIITLFSILPRGAMWLNRLAALCEWVESAEIPQTCVSPSAYIAPLWLVERVSSHWPLIDREQVNDRSGADKKKGMHNVISYKPRKTFVEESEGGGI